MTDDNDTGFVDAHVHVWSSDTSKYRISAKFSVSDMRPKSFEPDELFQHTVPAGISRVVLVQMSYYGTDNSYMLDTMAKHPGVFAGLGIVDHRSTTLAADIEKLKRQQIRGLRIYGPRDSDPEWPDDPGMQKLWEVCDSLGLAVCPLINPLQLNGLTRMCDRHPKATVVIDHMARIGIGKPARQFDINHLCGLAMFENVYVKVSAFYAMGTPPLYSEAIPTIRLLAESFGAGRLIWGSDCPYQVMNGHSCQASIDVIRKGCDFLSADERRKILKENAERLFFA
jgi:predicted TIM-barrel fold metal-dependent hydrolase